MKYLIDLTYDGSKFYGFQKQKNKQTIQGSIEEAISKIFNQDIKLIGASRTDRNVHAYNQYAHFEVSGIKDYNKFLNSLNKMLNKSIFIKSIYKVDDNFSARYSVKMKEYIYKINIGEYNPIEKEYVYQYCKNINLKKIRHAIKKIKGKHDFKSFTSDNEKENYLRTINDIRIIKKENYINIHIKAKSFLRYMVRNIVGLLLEINDDKKSIEDIDKIFKLKDRKYNAKPAEACGLYLNNIWYKKTLIK